jgi:hypothetical protein
MSIDELVALRDNANDKIAEKVAARQAELRSEIEKLSQYGKPAKKPAAASMVKAKKSGDHKRADQMTDGKNTDDRKDSKVEADHRGASGDPISQAA